MADFKTKYGASNQAITITFTSLANNGARQSTPIDNSSNLYKNALVSVKVKSNSSGTVATGYVNVYAYGTTDGGSTYGGVTGTVDGGVTLTSPPNLRLIGVINVVANSTVYESGPFSVASAFGGELPEKWGIVIENKSGATLDAAIGSAWYQGVYEQQAA